MLRNCPSGTVTPLCEHQQDAGVTCQLRTGITNRHEYIRTNIMFMLCSVNVDYSAIDFHNTVKKMVHKEIH